MNDPVPYQEEELLALIADGEEAAFHQLIAVYTPKLKGYVLKYTGSPADSDEILQNIFIRIWLHRDKLPGIQNFSGWIFTIAARLCISHFRQETKRQQQIQQLAVHTDNIERNTPDIHAQVSYINAVVYKTLSQMSARRRQIYDLNRNHGLKPAEIARRLSTNVGTVKNQLSSALKEIREALEAAGISILPLLLFFSKIL